MESRLFLDIVVGERSSVLQLLSRKDETLLVRGDSFLVLDLRFHVFDSVRSFHLQRDRFSYKQEDEKECRSARTYEEKRRKIQHRLIQSINQWQKLSVQSINQSTQHWKMTSYQLKSWRRSAFLHGDARRDEGSTPFGYCSPRAFVRPPTAFPQRWDAAGPEGFLPCPGSSLSRFRWCRTLPPPE